MDILEKIHGLNRFGSVLGLDRIRELLSRLGNPQEGLSYIHVAGTNGKGSVCKYLEQGLMSCGYSTGMYTSPFIDVFNERIQYNGGYIEDDEIELYGSQVLDKVDEIVKEGLPSPTEFEVVMAIAFMFFRDRDPDIVILEAGMGGIGDATNVIGAPEICAFTSVSFDHMAVLGSTLEAIASDKAGIIKTGAPVVSNVSGQGPAGVIAAVAEEKGCRLCDISGIGFTADEVRPGSQRISVELWGTPYEDVEISMSGRHQGENLKTALAVLEVLRRSGRIEIDGDRLRAGLKRAVQPCRFEIVGKEGDGPVVVIDGAHNDAGAAALEETAGDIFGGKRILIVAAVLADKEVDRIAAHFAATGDGLIAAQADSPRRLEASALAEAAEAAGCRVLMEADSAMESVTAARSLYGDYDVVIYAGSLYFAGDVRRILLDDRKRV